MPPAFAVRPLPGLLANPMPPGVCGRSDHADEATADAADCWE